MNIYVIEIDYNRGDGTIGLVCAIEGDTPAQLAAALRYDRARFPHFVVAESPGDSE